MLRFSKRSEANARIKAALDIASSLDGIVTPASKLDAKKDLFNMSNGTLNLKKLECREHRAEDLLTCKTSAKIKPGLQASRWFQFIWEVTGGDAANEAYLQKFCGYTLLANRPEQIILFLIGDGGDGKSVFIETIKHVLGDYQATLAATSISSSKKSSIPNDIAKLRGKRLATISELPKDLHVDTQMVKGISGGDTQTARFLHQEYFDFDPHAQLLIATNFYPYANPEDKAYFRRVAIMRFPVCFTDKQPDKNLAQTLKGEADGILTWMIDGLRGYLEEGLYPTPSMLFEKEQYNRFADPLSIFFDEYLEATDERDFVMSRDMDAHFEKFQEIEQRRGITKEEMRKFLHRKGYERKQRRIGSDRFRGYVGLNLRIFRDDDIPF
jgi:putative DNA primase/helicase